MEERTIDRTELYTADEAFLCGSAMELTPILSIDAYAFEKTEIVDMLRRTYVDVASGRNKQFREWLTGIYRAEKRA